MWVPPAESWYKQKIDGAHIGIEVACNHLNGLLKEPLYIGAADDKIGQFSDITEQIQVISVSVFGFHHYTTAVTVS